MNEEREKVRCNLCELVQWGDRPNCRRCNTPLPQPVVNIVERVVEKVVIRHDRECIRTSAQVPEAGAFPTMAEVERAMIVAAYQRSNRRANEAARLLGIGTDDVLPQAAQGQSRVVHQICPMQIDS